MLFVQSSGQSSVVRVYPASHHMQNKFKMNQDSKQEKKIIKNSRWIKGLTAKKKKVKLIKCSYSDSPETIEEKIDSYTKMFGLRARAFIHSRVIVVMQNMSSVLRIGSSSVLHSHCHRSPRAYVPYGNQHHKQMAVDKTERQ